MSSELDKLLELKHRIEFLQNIPDENALIMSIEKEMAEFLEFQYRYDEISDLWQYYIRCCHSNVVVGDPYPNRLKALFVTITNFIRSYNASKTVSTKVYR